MILITLWAMLLASRGTAAGRILHRWLVEAPARWLARITRGHVLMASATLIVVATVIWVMQADGLIVLGMAAPDMFVMASMVDVSMLLDVTLVAIAAASMLRVRAIRHWIGHIAPRRPRARAVRVRRERPPANDDEDRPGWALTRAA